jgi:hypothetical protein
MSILIVGVGDDLPKDVFAVHGVNGAGRGEPLGAAEVLIPLVACGALTLACLASVTWMLKRAKLLG